MPSTTTHNSRAKLTQAWLNARGLRFQLVHPWEQRSEDHPQRYVIAEGRSPRDVMHTVIADLSQPITTGPDASGTERNHVAIVHDPHPSRAGIDYPMQLVEIVPIPEAKS